MAIAHENKAFGAAVREARKRLGLRIEDCCAQSGLSYSTWISAENGTNFPRWPTWRRMKAVLGVELSALMARAETLYKSDAT